MFDLIFLIFGAPTGEQVLGLVLVGLIALTICGWKGIIARQTVPGLMTSLGIFGTFWGVFIALYPLDFSPGKMNESIEFLLGGMTTAFSTSLLGLAFAIGTKVFWSRTSASKKALPPEQKEIIDHLKAIKQSISEDGNSSLVTQMQIMRTENRDGFAKIGDLNETIRDALVANLENLVEQIQEIIGNQLGGALQNLIDGIQEALIEQFGETFVEFNQAVQDLNAWQHEYRDQVVQLTHAFDQSAKRIAEIRDQCEAIPAAMQNLNDIVGLVNGQLNAMNENLAALDNMREQAVNAIPQLNETIQNIGEQFATQMNAEMDRVTRQWGDDMVAIANACAQAAGVADQPDNDQ